jgi:hypothetical protein
MKFCPSKRNVLASYAMLLVLLLPVAPLGAQDGFHVDAGVMPLYGPADGHLQTPEGGQPGTTSDGRPTFDELGITSVTGGDFWMNLSRGHHGFYAGGRLMRLSGDGLLDEALLSQNINFVASVPVTADVKFDWYRVGYRYLYQHDFGGRTVDFYPSLGATFLDFHYRLSSPGLDGVDRAYVKVGAQAGLGVAMPLTERLSLTGQVFAPIPFPHTPKILSAQLGLKYRFLEKGDLRMSGLFGVGYDWISYKDGQEMPNDLEARMGPMGMLGLEVQF